MANWWDEAPLADAAPQGGAGPFAGAISSIESSGNYRAIGPVTKTGDRALGKYQVMGANVGPWSREILGREVTPQEFISNNEIQDAIFKGKFGQYAEKYGPEGAAKAWFAGEKGMNNPNARDVLGTTVASYGAKFNKALGYAPEEKRPTDVSASKKANWWDDAPLAQDVPQESTSTPQLEAGANGGPKRLVMDMTSKKPDAGYVDAAARGVASGVTGNFSDEISGLQNAAPSAVPTTIAGIIPAKAIVGGARLASNAITGMDPKAVADYQSARDETRSLNQAAEENYPVTSIAGNVAGALAVPAGAAAKGAGFLTRVGKSAGLGTIFGAVSGAGEGEGVADSATKAATGAAVGGAIGGVAVPVLSAVEAAGRGIAKVASPIVTNVRGLLNTDAEAARRIAVARARDAKTGKPGMTDAEFDAAKAQGLPVINADRGGETTQALARSAANTSPEGRTALEVVTSERYATQSPRTARYLKETFDFPEPGPTLDRLEEAARRENRPAYNKAYSEGQSIWDDGLEQYAQAPVVQKAIQLAFVTGRNKAAMDGFPPMKNPFVMNRETGVLELQPGATPNLQFWDHVKRNLDKMGAEGQAFSKALRNHLDEIVPSYAEARAGAAKFFGAENALEAGAKYATMSGRDTMSMAEAHKGLSKMGKADRKLFQTGFVSNLIAKIESAADGRDVVKLIFNSETARNQIKLVVGEQRAAELEARLVTERAMNGIKNAIQGNSTTARQWIERGMAGGATGLGGVGAYDTDPQKLSAAALVGALAAGSRHIDTKVARRVAEMLASDNPQILKAGTSIVAKSKALREAFRTLNIPSARIGGSQAPTVPALQAAGVSRAEDQPDVPRPPGQ
jgi:hypothetical protein